MIAVFIQARMSSTRLPGKVLKTILGKPMLGLQIERILSCKTTDRVVVVTSTAPQDQEIVDFCKRSHIDYFCGNLENVLDRFYHAACAFKPGHIVRITGDCPLIDPDVVDRMIRLYLDNNCDYGTNCVPPTYPDGLDAEVFTMAALARAQRDAVLPSHLEHISPFFEEQPDIFKTVNLAHETDLSELRWTVDEPEDFEFVKNVFEALYPSNPMFGMEDILSLLRQKPQWAGLNRHFIRNEGLLKSKEKDRNYIKNKSSGK